MKTTTTILALALLAVAVCATAEDLPVQAERIWAPTGDLIGLENHATGTFHVLDDHGEQAKGAEDWQRLGKYAGSGLLGWHKTWDSGYRMDVRGFGTSASGAVGGRYSLAGNLPGHAKWSLVFRNARQHYDRTSEMRDPVFKAPPAPPALDVAPRLNWRMMDLGVGYRPNETFSFVVDYDRKCRDSAKGSLGRGIWGDAAPALKSFETTVNEFRLGAALAADGFGMDLGLTYRAADGDRAQDAKHLYKDDQKLWRLQLDLGWDVSGRTRIIGGVLTSSLKNEGSETIAAGPGTSNAESKTTGGRLGVMTRLGDRTSFRLTGNLHNLNTDAAFDDGSALPGTDRERSRQELRAVLANSSLKRTRLQLGYRYRKADLEENTGIATLQQRIEQDSKQHDLDFKGRYRFSRSALLKGRVGWQKLDVDQVATGDAIAYTMGDRKRDRVDWELKLQTRPHRKFKLDLGYQGLDQTYERVIMAGVETTWKAQRGFLNLNWLTLDQLTLHGTVSAGNEKYGLAGDPEPTGTMGTIAYNGTTLRYMPGASWRVVPGLRLDGMWEGVRFTDDANASPGLDKLESDHDRVLVRAAWSPQPKLTVSATYQRREFFEQRWDNYIQDLYALSVGGRF